MKVICTEHEKCPHSGGCGHGEVHDHTLECYNDCTEHGGALCLKVIE
jgi:hypothetical protein